MSENEPNPDYVNAPYRADIIEIKDGKMVHRVETEQPTITNEGVAFTIDPEVLKNPILWKLDENGNFKRVKP